MRNCWREISRKRLCGGKSIEACASEGDDMKKRHQKNWNFWAVPSLKMRGLRRYLRFVLFCFSKKVNMDGVERSKLEGLDWHPIEAEKVFWLM